MAEQSKSCIPKPGLGSPCPADIQLNYKSQHLSLIGSPALKLFTHSIGFPTMALKTFGRIRNPFTKEGIRCKMWEEIPLKGMLSAMTTVQSKFDRIK